MYHTISYFELNKKLETSDILTKQSRTRGTQKYESTKFLDKISIIIPLDIEKGERRLSITVTIQSLIILSQTIDL